MDEQQDKNNKERQGKRFEGWAGALKDMRDEFTSVELQHKISEWRMESVLKGVSSPNGKQEQTGEEGSNEP